MHFNIKNITRVNLFMCLLMLLPIGVALLIYGFNLRLGIALESMLNHFLAILLPSLLIIMLSKSRAADILKLNRISLKTVALTIVLSFVMQPIFYFISVVSAIIFPNLITEVAVAIVTDNPFVLSMLTLAIFPAICEEIAIRGVVLHGCRHFSLVQMVLLNGLFFGLFHTNGHQFVYTFLYGIIFSYLVLITDSILPSMIAHFCVNGSQVLMLYKSTDVTADTQVDALPEIPPGAMVFILAFALLIVGLSVILTLLTLKGIRKANANGIAQRKLAALKAQEETLDMQNNRIVSWSFIPVFLIFFAYLQYLR